MEGADQESSDAVLEHVVDALYAVAPTDFVAARTARVKGLRADGLRETAKQVAALRRPSVAAAAVNATVRADDPVVARLEDLGARMRHAQSALDASALSALRGEREEVLAAWVAAAREHAGGLTAAVEAEVRDTAVAALADAAASEVVTSGSLTRALSYSGFGEVDVADAVARTSTGVVLTRLEGGRGEQPAQDEDEDAEEPAQDEDEDAEEPAQDEDTPRPATRSARGGAVGDLEMALDAAEKVVAAARAARKQAATDQAAAQEAATGAVSRVEQAEQLLREAREESERAVEVAEAAARTLEAAEAELRRSRQERDTARAALEEAEDR
ncbi:hypothetical protein [Ornithinimicrobium avium]|uniref:Uncharacterized protein n=1 Tax=Ornithinimicrobium avium TaxID=2283195 RepID=A0A345NNA4_9MICO|nr:hypothetical protein [Ornithinimicrobium avium]AXH96512.1 hypothetical protein DV701_10580 [Ornithinimicrobium avium]